MNTSVPDKKLHNSVCNTYPAKVIFDAPKMLYWILLASLMVRVIYVYYFTDYSSYLTSDAGGYWHRALQRFDGEAVNIGRWWLWPPFPHILLSMIFEVIDLIRLTAYRLELVLFVNILASTVNSYLMYRIAAAIGFSRRWSLWICAFSAFYYPMIYFNAFTLALGPSSLFMMISLYCLLCVVRKNVRVIFAGFFLALAAACKPSLGIMAVPYGLYLLSKFRLPFRNLIPASLFSAAFLLVIAGVVAENYRLSDGKLKGLGAAGGINYFMKQCQVHTLTYKMDYKNVSNVITNIIPAATVLQPNLGTFEAKEPFYNQDYYYELANKCIDSNPNIWFENLSSLRNMFGFGLMYPLNFTSPVFLWLLVASRVIIGIGLMGAICAIIVGIGSRRLPYVLLLFSMFACYTLVHYFLNVDHRHSYSMFPILLLLSSICLKEGLENRRKVPVIAVVITILFPLIVPMKLFSSEYWNTDTVTVLPPQYGFFEKIVHSAITRKQMEVNITDTDKFIALGIPWNTPGNFKLYEPGIAIMVPNSYKYTANKIELSIDSNDQYEISIFANEKVLHRVVLGETVDDSSEVFLESSGMVYHTIMIGRYTQDRRITKIEVKPLAGDGSFSLGHLILL